MAMRADLHTIAEEARIGILYLERCNVNVVNIEDSYLNQVSLYMSLEQMEELADKLKEYVEEQRGI